ncbi:DUF2919 domain-containing protein [Ferrimonas balearica]|uniref:DUF2919 domain-containing protein n=1 Tax=Ferrimonas balearica TaxID=44012 RepID=UPI001C99E38B|nr:DUF2919 domain-containing protein [Ferrimonas balearica]MBY5921169.1 DUF2919 domain-containing protein [Ferrimonas balearica]MBY5996146.1 DUF2919 domain-containing protein [Ferrimonas balearica]
MGQYTFDDFDRYGLLKPGPWLILVLLFCAKTWLLFLLSAASRQHGADLMGLFYPDRQDFYLGLLLGLPALALLWAQSQRHKGGAAARLWQWGRPLLLASWSAHLVLQIKAIYLSHGAFHWAPALMLMLSFWTGLYLLKSHHCRTVFEPVTDSPEHP